MVSFLELVQDPAAAGTLGSGYVVDDQSWLGSAFGTNECESIMLDGALCLAAFPNGVVPSGVVLAKITATGKYAPYSGSGQSAQTVTLANATGGTFTLTYDGATTAAIAYNASGANAQTALEALPNIQPGDVTVGKVGSVFTVSFVGTRFLGNAPSVPLMTANGGSLTGSSPTVTVAAATGSGNVSANEVQTVTVSNAYAGTFVLYFEGEATVPLPYNATATQVQNALLDTAVLDTSDVIVTGGPAGTSPLTLTFGGRYVGADVPTVVADDSGLSRNPNTDGPPAVVTVTTSTQGNRGAGTGGQEVPTGHLFTVKDVTPHNASVPRDTSAALYWHGKVVKAKLPPNSGYDANVASTLTRIRYV